MSAFLQQRLGVVGVARERADADRPPGMELGAVQLERLGEHVVHAPRHPAGGIVDHIVVEVGQQHQELVSALPGDQIGLADARVQPLGELLQHQIAGMVAERVVHQLEVVEVEEDDRHGRVVALGPLDRQDQRLLEQLPVREAGQAVVIGHVRDPRLRILQLRDVEQDPVFEDGPALLVTLGVCAVADPHHPAIRADHAVVVEIAADPCEERVALRPRPARDRRDAPCGARGPGRPCRPPASPRGCARSGGSRRSSVAVVGVDHGGDLLDQAPVPRLRLGQAPPGPHGRRAARARPGRRRRLDRRRSAATAPRPAAPHHRGTGASPRTAPRHRPPHANRGSSR